VQDLQTSKGGLGSPMNQNRLPSIRLLRCLKRPRSLLRQSTTHRSNARASQNASDRTWPWRLQGQRRLQHPLRRVVHRTHLRDSNRPSRSALVLGALRSQQTGELYAPTTVRRRWTRPRPSLRRAGSSGRRGRGWKRSADSRGTPAIWGAAAPGTAGLARETAPSACAAAVLALNLQSARRD
jgi:hypothetical protein